MPVWERIVRNYFRFNRRERRGISILIILLIILSSIHSIIKFWPTSNIAHSELDHISWDQFEEQTSTYEKSPKTDTTNVKIETSQVIWHRFNPNTANQDELTELGLEAAVAKRIVNYRNKGGRFRKTSDLAKMYGMDSLWLQSAMPFIDIDAGVDSFQNKSSFEKRFRSDTNTRSFKHIEIVELNIADSSELVILPFIGPFFAKEIVKLRNSLGGFISYDQIVEIYQMRDQTMESIVKHTTLDPTLISPINLNECTLETLGRHPYLTWKQAKVIVNYRSNHGKYKTTKDILKTQLISDSLFSKLEPYIVVQ